MWWPKWVPWDSDISDFSLQRFALEPWAEIDYSKFSLVQIIDDCRNRQGKEDIESAKGKYGICLWQFDWGEMTDEDWNILPEIDLDNIDLNKRLPADSEEGNPLIKLENGDYIWGIECWFQSVHKWENFSLEEAEEGVKFLIDWILSKYGWVPAND